MIERRNVLWKSKLNIVTKLLSKVDLNLNLMVEEVKNDDANSSIVESIELENVVRIKLLILWGGGVGWVFSEMF